MKKFAIAGIAALAIAGSTAVYAQHRPWFHEHMQHMRMSPEDRAAFTDAHRKTNREAAEPRAAVSFRQVSVADLPTRFGHSHQADETFFLSGTPTARRVGVRPWETLDDGWRFLIAPVDALALGHPASQPAKSRTAKSDAGKT